MKARASYPRQVDATTCGIAALAVVASRAGTDPQYIDADPDRVARTQLALHAVAARKGLWWPQALGTSPWALASLAKRATGKNYRIHWGRSIRPAIDSCLCSGADAFAYTGGSDARFDDLIPRHVIAILADQSDVSTGIYAVFEPSSGLTHRVQASSLIEGAANARPALGYWKRPLLAVTA